MNRNHTVYTALGVGLGVLLHVALQDRLTVHPYATWLGAFTVVTWALFVWDKRVAQMAPLLKGSRVPEFTLNLLALLGGFLGGWVARSMFRHKTNVKKHPWILVGLIVGTLIHVYLTARIIYGPELALWPPGSWVDFSG